jgi:multiple sugar transport system permease protein
MSTPFMVIILLAGLLSVPQEPVEAAEVDGAGSWQRFRYVIFPMVQPYIYVALAVRSLDISRAYDVVRIMTDGGPAHRTELIWTYVTRIVTDQNDLGLGAAMGMVTVVVSSAFTVYLFRQLLKARYRR